MYSAVKGWTKGYQGKNNWTYRDNSPSCRKKPKHESLIIDRPADVLYYIEKHYNSTTVKHIQWPRPGLFTSAHWCLASSWISNCQLAFFSKRHFLISYQALDLVCFFLFFFFLFVYLSQWPEQYGKIQTVLNLTFCHTCGVFTHVKGLDQLWDSEGT